MSLLETLMPLMSESCVKLDLSITAANGDICLRVSPLVGEVNSSATSEVKRLKAALAVPLKINGTLGEIEAGLVERVRGYVVRRNDWEAQLQRVEVAATPSEKKSAKTEPVENESEGSDFSL
mgnify:CR=1 FL=1